MTAYISTGWAKKVVQSSNQLIDDATVQDKTKQAVSRKTGKPAEEKKLKKPCHISVGMELECWTDGHMTGNFTGVNCHIEVNKCTLNSYFLMSI